MTDKLTFDEASHEYRMGGVRVPSVTQILRDLSLIARLPDGMLAEASVRGKMVHKAVELYNQDDLDESTVHQDYMPYLRAWKRFCDDHQYEPLINEPTLYSHRWGYAGTPDTFGSWKQIRKRPRVLLDVKTGGTDPCHGPQTAAYVELLREEGLLSRVEMPQRAIVRLQPNGMYQVDPMLDPGDWSVFMSSLTVYRFKEKHGIT